MEEEEKSPGGWINQREANKTLPALVHEINCEQPLTHVFVGPLKSEGSEDLCKTLFHLGNEN